MSDTKKCPYCSEEILIEARKCKHCGEYLDESLRKKPAPIPAPAPIKTEVVAKEGCFLQTLNTGCMIILAIILLSFVIGLLSSL